ncbi:NADH-quinone oxidoreductase subunit G [Enemella sp. A6]|uniref:NADH-quinone oxidoreductase subunit G n=1 Tax=Enemella sp. A6 TaxID=3440152 RepID=UPI003EBD1B97
MTAIDKGTDKSVVPAEKQVQISIDDVEMSVPEGTLIIRAAEDIGIPIPRFCDHPLLDPAGACRQCLVDVVDDGRGRPMPKPQASCTLTAMPGMKVRTQRTSPVADKAQHGMMEFLLVNHPLDCPICDKGGECPLQNQAMSNGRAESRFTDVKRTFPKPIHISAQVLLDRERCIMCQRCTRFSEQIAGDPFIDLAERGVEQQVAIYANEPFESYFSGNTIQICPVGALTSEAYRFRARPFDLVSVPSVCEHCASGCALRVDYRRTTVMRRLAGPDMAVNEEWNCDKGRFAFVSGRADDRVRHPLVREDGVLREASWAEALDVAARGLAQAGSEVGVLTGGRLTNENAYGYAKFARVVLGTNDIDFRARPTSLEESAFLATHVAAKPMDVTYEDLENASSVLLVNFEPEEESPIVFLRLRKAWRKKKLKVWTVAPFLSAGAEKMGATLVRTVPGTAAKVLAEMEDVHVDADTVIMVGERALEDPGALTEVTALAGRTGARVAWVPRRAGERGSLDAGCLPNLLPGGRPVADAGARVDAGAVWEVPNLPAEPGRDSEQILVAAAEGKLKALVVAGVELADLADPAGARTALENTDFVVSFETRFSEAAARADVVFPVALVEEQAGSFTNWEGRHRPFKAVLPGKTVMTDLRALAALADALGKDLGVRTTKQAAAELAEFSGWTGERVDGPAADPVPDTNGMVLASWRMLIDDSRGNDGEVALLATGRRPVVRVGYETAERLGVTDGDRVRVSTAAGAVVMPVAITPGMAEDVVWLPRSSAGQRLAEDLGAVGGAPVDVTKSAEESNTAGGVA